MNPLYFAYGSNLDLTQMVDRCPGASLLQEARTYGRTLAFAGHSASRGGAVATLLGDLKGVTHGVLYGLDRRHFAELDLCEGHPWLYRRQTITVVDAYGARRQAQTYILDRPLGLPSVEYVQVIARGYSAHGLPHAALKAAIWRSTQPHQNPGFGEKRTA
jgi:gamma-glutamylcyclotransferase (GGCT)/AIG2-like uncharacterized protein YtfP